MAHQLNLNTEALEELKAKAQALPAEKKVQASKSVTPGTTEQTVSPDSGYDGLASVSVEAMPQGRMGPIGITVSSSGLITAQPYVDSPGYITQAEMDSNTKQLTVQGAQTITPGTANKTIASGRYLTGTQTIKGDPNLIAENIAKGVSIFNVTGTHEGGEDVSAETAEYTELLTDLETAIDALPEAGGGGGGSVETCTLTFVNSNDIFVYGARLNEAGEIVPMLGDTIGDESSLTVIKGAGITFINEHWAYNFEATIVTGAVFSRISLQGGMVSFYLTDSAAHFEFVSF